MPRVVTIPSNPVGVTAVWMRVLRPTLVKAVNGSSAVAQRLAADIDDAPLVTHGTYGCPADFGIDVTLAFRYRVGNVVAVNASLTGCASITVRTPFSVGEARSVTTKLRHDLVALSPPPWAREWLTNY